MTPPATDAAPSTRADAVRNRQRIIETAAAAFAADEAVSMDAIARRAGLGSGTLYRHFPAREDLVEAVYRDQITRLRDGARDLLARHRPARALALWTGLLADWAATKHGMQDALRQMMAGGRLSGSQMRSEFVDILHLFTDAGRTSGDLSPDVDPVDLAATLVALISVAGAPQQRPQLDRMTALVLNGVVVPAARRPASR